MFDSPPPQPQPDPAQALQREIYHHLVRTLRLSLPAPVDDAPETLDRRDRIAIAQAAALLPANIDETDLAARYVAAAEQASDCLRLARQHAADVKRVAQLYAQSVSMMRESRGYRSLLLRVQAVREKRDANPVGRDNAAWTEHAAFGLMSGALASLPPEPPPPPAPPAEPPPHIITPEEMAQQDRQERLEAQASRYAILNLARVKLIRQLGGLPENCDYPPPEPDLLHVIITGNGYSLRFADTYKPYVA